ncbi:DUF6732 family protein [Hoeflea sp. TYP-13]|uniref:DUF6732 family protein n=1 Tax=Hoeflea sp. TYP-13 TaxID=3230023 RepID=UPI0034C5D24D
MTRSFCVLTAFLCSASAAHAHGGHVGELAGHAHWVGIAATLGAAALAALAAKAGKRKDKADDEQSADAESEEQAEGAAA